MVEPANGMRSFGEVKIKVAQQRYIVCAYKLRYHVVWFVDYKITVLRFVHKQVNALATKLADKRHMEEKALKIFI